MRYLSQLFTDAVSFGSIDTGKASDFGFSLTLEIDSWKEISPKTGKEVTKRVKSTIRILGKTATTLEDALLVVAKESKIAFKTPSDVAGKVSFRAITRPMTGERAAVLIAHHCMKLPFLEENGIDTSSHLIAMKLMDENETPANETPANETPANETPANETPANRNKNARKRPELPASRANVGQQTEPVNA